MCRNLVRLEAAMEQIEVTVQGSFETHLGLRSVFLGDKRWDDLRAAVRASMEDCKKVFERISLTSSPIILSSKHAQALRLSPKLSSLLHS